MEPTFDPSLYRHSVEFDEANRLFPYDLKRRISYFYLENDEKEVERFRKRLLKALNRARERGTVLPVVIAAHVVKDTVDVVNGDTIFGYLDKHAFKYAIIVEFSR